jgi:preprotein translocase subunit YajC
VLGIIFLATSSSTSSASPFSPLLMIGLLGVVFYFLLIRPQRRNQAKQREAANEVDPGDEIVTHGGMYGLVTEVDDDEGTILLEVAPGIEIRMLKQAIARRVTLEEDGGAQDDGADAAAGSNSAGGKQPKLGDGAKTPGEKEADEQR